MGQSTPEKNGLCTQDVHKNFTQGWHHTVSGLNLRAQPSHSHDSHRTSLITTAIVSPWPQGLRRCLSTASCALALWGLPALVLSQPATRSDLPELGDGSDLSTAQESRIGERIVRDLYRDPSYLDDPVLMDYLQSIWQPLLAAARQRGELTAELDERFSWRLMLLRDPSVNAFALPGGYLGLHLGLMAIVSSRDELASVLGHELSHVTQRHIARMMSKSSRQAPWMMAAMILGVLAASKNPDAGNAMIVGGQALGVQSQLNFSRDMEREADRVGFGVVTQAGYRPEGFVGMFDKLQQASRLNDTGAYPYLRTHPLSTERLADMQARIPLSAAPEAPVAVNLVDAFMRVRAKVLISPDAGSLQTWRAILDEPAASKPVYQQLFEHYGAALAALQVRDVRLARQYVQALRALLSSAQSDKAHALDAQVAQYLIWLSAEVDLAARDLTPTALSQLDATLAETSSNARQRRPVLLMRAQLSLQLGTSDALKRAAQDLQAWLLTDPADAMAWHSLSELHAALKLDLRSLRAAAEAQFAQKNLGAALDRLRAAQDLARKLGANPSAAEQIEASIIDTRFRQVSALVKAQALER